MTVSSPQVPPSVSQEPRLRRGADGKWLPGGYLHVAEKQTSLRDTLNAYCRGRDQRLRQDNVVPRARCWRYNPGNRLLQVSARPGSRPDPRIARQQRDADATRSRRKFDLRVKLCGPLNAWHRAIEVVRPGAAIWNFPDTGLPGRSGCISAASRRPTDIFDQMMDVQRTPNSAVSRD